MIPAVDLKSIARARLDDAKVLLKGHRPDGAVYLCGYAVEMALKARLCRTLKWTGFPETGAEFQGLQSIKTHNLEILLRLSGVEGRIKTRLMREWSLVLGWDPEKRYRTLGQFTEQQAKDMIAAVTKLVRVL
jgi:hypothetical protein